LEENLNYKIKIDVPNVIELISETFDNVLNYMLPGMLVYGGVLRDIIAGFGLHHDLDIAATPSEKKEFIHYLGTSSKWMEESVVAQYKKRAGVVESKVLDVISPHSMKNGMVDLKEDYTYRNRTGPKFSSYNNNIQDVKTFINSSGRKLQIITAKPDLFTLKEPSPLLVVRAVDLICCGIMMDINGNVYEIVEGAKDDCVKKILRINENADIEFHNLNKRIKKFVARGWKSEIDLAKVKRKQTRLKKVAERKTDGLEKQNNFAYYLYTSPNHFEIKFLF